MVRRKKRKRFKAWRLVALLLVAVLSIYVFESFSGFEDHHSFESQRSEENDNGGIASPPTFAEAEDAVVQMPSDLLYSSNAILVGLKDHTVLMRKGEAERIYPASLTKIMTAIVAMENLPDLQEKIKLSDSMFDRLYAANASMAGFRPGEEVHAIDLLYGALLPSGAECCIGLAERIAGSEQGFAELMNRKAADLGMTDTHFTNTTGLHDENHYSTVKDLAVLLAYALENSGFRDIFTSSHHSAQPTNKHPDGITFSSTMFTNLETPSIPEGKILGGKTGYTGKAGLCLASLAEIKGTEYVLVTAGAEGSNLTEPFHIIDAVETYCSVAAQ